MSAQTLQKGDKVLETWHETCNEPNDIVAVTGDELKGADVAEEASGFFIMNNDFITIEKTLIGQDLYHTLNLNVTAFALQISVKPVQLSWIQKNHHVDY